MNTKREIELLKKKARTPEHRKVYVGGDKRLLKISCKRSILLDATKTSCF